MKHYDVVVVGEAPKAPVATTPVNMNLTLDLNNNVRFSGSGLDVTLGGRLNLVAKPGQEVQGVGTVTVVKGQYKAYGQNLEISKGNISFVGPLSDPNLNIRAERRLSPVGAGVEVLGSLNNPRVTLVANEPMSEKDKLSWLILNRASSGSDSDEAALGAAAGGVQPPCRHGHRMAVRQTRAEEKITNTAHLKRSVDYVTSTRPVVLYPDSV